MLQAKKIAHKVNDLFSYIIKCIYLLMPSIILLLVYISIPLYFFLRYSKEFDY